MFLESISSKKECEKNDNCFCRKLESALTNLPEEAQIYVNIIKPILFGKILFAPNSSVISDIIGKANNTFVRIEIFKNLLKDLVGFFTRFESELDEMTSLMLFNTKDRKNGVFKVFSQVSGFLIIVNMRKILIKNRLSFFIY